MQFPPNEVQVVLTMHASRVQEFAEYLRRTAPPGGPSPGSLLARVLDQFAQQGHGARLAVIDPEDRQQVERLRDYCWKGGDLDRWQGHLREFADPKPPTYTTHNGTVAPWPVVNECHSRLLDDGHECPQCAWAHEHEWVEWTSFPTGRGKPVRCSKCGGRKCDQDDCALQRHHGTNHSPVQP